MKSNSAESFQNTYYLMTVLMGIDVTEAVLKWSSKAEKLLKEIQQ